jgi:hypothetical protein
MPLPFLIPIALGLAGAFGVGKTVKAVIDNSDAKDIRKEATSIASDANEKMEKSKENTNKLLSDFGRKKLDVYQTTLSDFVDIYKKIGAIKS